MAGQRQPTNLILAKGTKHFTREEIKERLSSEVQPCADDITAPSYLTAGQKKRFDKIAGQLCKIKIMGETDVEALARYVVVQENYEQVVKDLRAVQRQRPKGEAATVEALLDWAAVTEKLDKRLERYTKQARSLASDLGLTISSRVKLVVPVREEAPKVNKFSAFDATRPKGGEPPHVSMH